MMHKKLFLSVAIFTSALSGCSSNDEGDDVTIIIDGNGTNSSVASSSSVPSGDCALVEQASFVSFNNTCSTGTISGTISTDYTLIEEVEWILDGEVIVGNGNQSVSNNAQVQAVKDSGVTLTIEAGTNIKAFDDGSLLVTRGSKLMADGTPSKPITFSSADSNFDGYGEWGGVIIQGFAPQYGQGGIGACYGAGSTCNVVGEGGTVVGNYGGNEPADNSGVIRYVRIAEGGKVAGPNNEINGLTLQGVGHGTTIEYIQVHNNLDDGVEWFGGTVNVKYLVLTNNDDDDIDFDEGYQGNIQYAIVQKDPNKSAPTGNNDPRGIEANSSDDDYVEETRATLANITILGSAVNKAQNDSGDGLQPGMRLRGALTTSVYNSAVSNFDDCIRIDDADVNKDGSIDAGGVDKLSSVALENIIGACDDKFYAKRSADSEANLLSEVFTLTSTYAIAESFASLGGATAINAVDNGSGFVFDQTDYIGAVDPAAPVGWWEGWIIPGSLSTPEPVETSFASCDDSGEPTVCTLQGVIDQDYTMVRGVEWILDGEVLVGEGNVGVTSTADVTQIKNNGVTLTIDAGVSVKAYDDGSLLVTRGSKLHAVGTAANPITFSSLDDGYDGEGEWGGVIIQGFAPQYGQGGIGPCYADGEVCNVVGEGGTVVGNYGGNDPADDSGMIKYVRIAEGGKVAGPGNEINGLTLQGVGYGTTLEYVQVHGNLDDGIEWFGGTVNAKYLVLTNNDDDDIDFDEGYKGNIQYAIIRKNPTKAAPTGENDPRGIEANSSDDDFVTETEGALSNILVWGSEVNKAQNDAGDGSQPGMRLRGALTTRIYNTAVKNFADCVRVDDADVNKDKVLDFDDVDVPSVVTLENVIGECDDDFYANRDADTEAGSVGPFAVTVDAAYALSDAHASVTEVNPVEVDNGSGFNFDNTSYVGAVEPGTDASDAWWAGWIIEGSLP